MSLRMLYCITVCEQVKGSLVSLGRYGRHGTVGLATPQANPTAEIEYRALLPDGVACATARMVSKEPNPEARLRAYFIDIATTLERFDTLSMDCIGLACTGSSYLLGHEVVESNLAALSAQRGYPVVSAAAAIERALQHIGAEKIAVVCPYPDWLLSGAVTHWQARGFKVADQFSLDPNQSDTRAIYSLSPENAARLIENRWQNVNADAYLITGTGLPTLRAIADLSGCLSAPVLSSNLCLAWATLVSAGIPPRELEPTAAMPLLAGWQDRIHRL